MMDGGDETRGGCDTHCLARGCDIVVEVPIYRGLRKIVEAFTTPFS